MNSLENNYAKCWIEEGILYSTFKGPLDMKLDIMKEIIAIRHEVSNGKKQYWCFFAHGIKSYPKEARDYSAIHGQDFIHAVAAVVNSHIAMFIFNAFLKINKPSIPFKAFRTEAEAVTWLRKLKAENEAKGIF